MLRSMYSGISGMKNQQVKMDTIGNNIANLNSVAFKGSRVTFKDALVQTSQSASGPTFSTGGTNARQVGLGMAVSSIDRNMAAGTNSPTARATDIAIDGNGFFMVKNGPEIFYTRDGSFTMDRYGDLVTSSGMRVQGQDKDGNKGNINIPREHDTVPEIKLGTTTTGTPPVTKEVLSIKLLGFDGNIDTLKNIKIDQANDGGENPISVTGGEMTIRIKGYSSLPELERAVTKQLSKIQDTEDESSLSDPDKEINNLLKAGIKGIRISGDLTVAQDATKGEPKVMDESRPEGATAGSTATEGFLKEKIQLGSFAIGKDGKITCVYGEDDFEVARIRVGTFVNDNGLEAVGGNLYRSSANSGQATEGFPGDIGFGTTEQGFLEMSNVDLANEFTDMIITSRSYQANSRTITTSDEMLQELLNLKR